MPPDASQPALPDTLGDSLIPVINKLQDIFSEVTVDLKLDLPQVAVIGSQSSGKSSVLEALVGRDFLPRGSDIVTRRPLILQLIKTQPGAGPSGLQQGSWPSLPGSSHSNSSSSAAANGPFSNSSSGRDASAFSSGGAASNGASSGAVASTSSPRGAGGGSPTGPTIIGRPNGAEFGEFLHAQGKYFYDFDRIRAEIQAETERLLGTNKNVSDKPIRLKIYSPRVLTMTLVDLPGLTKVPVGDQPSNIEHRIREMVLSYIRSPSCIILAVTPANSDLATSDALQMAQVVDPDGLRTIGVLTKLDIMDRGTNALHILRNQHIPLRLGYIAVVNRSQEDINLNRPMSEARKSEDAFFASRPEYRELMGSQCGVASLARRLNVILVDHIRQLLPGLRRRVAEAVDQRLAERKTYGDPEPLRAKGAKGAFLLQLLCDYSERYAAMLDGRHLDLSLTALAGGARIRYVFTDVFGNRLQNLAPAADVSDQEIATVIKNGAGVSGNLLVPQEPFELLVRRSITALLPPALQCKELVYEELLKIAEQSCPREAARFPALQRQLAAAVVDFIRQGAEPAEKMIRALVDCQLDYINTDHPEFEGGRKAYRAVQHERTMRKAQETSEVQSTPPSASTGAKGGPTGGKGATGVPAAGEGNGSGKPGSAVGLAGMGLKSLQGLPESHSGQHPADLLSRQRRRSDDGFDTGSGSGAGGGWFTTWFGKGDNGGRMDAATASPSPAAAAASSSAFGGSQHGLLGAGTVSRSLDDLTLMTLPHRLHGGRLRNEQEEIEVEVIRKLVESYFDLVRRALQDQVPKAIMFYMVNHTKRGLQQHLIRSLYREDILDALLTEHEDIVAKRAACQEALHALQAAATALEQLPTELTTYSVLMAGAAATAAAVGVAGGGGGGGHHGLHHGHASDPSVGSLGRASGAIDRHPSMSLAARVAASAAASLHTYNTSGGGAANGLAGGSASGSLASFALDPNSKLTSP